ncbi:biotin--[acetyl-CoA-carboxylase] ligase [Kerstersia similis]|uniref:biotin--[acetyl-CoA-carboxylase] ligase n=1 Tax=Kerstersia similis TaxID=206505 RepID=UPI0039EE65DE
MSMPTALFSLPAAATLQSQLAPRLADFGMLRWVEETGSTNADLMMQAREAQAPALPWLLGAHLQVQGRGRAGRPWNAAPGAALMLSCAFETTAAPALLPSLSLVAGIAACEALRRHAGDNAGQVLMKWPNDLQYGDAKLAGILVETTRQPATGQRIVVMGMGLNLRDAAAISQHFCRAVADWGQVIGSVPTCSQDWLNMASTLAADIARAWQNAIRLHATEGFQPFLARHASMDALAQRPINVLEDGRLLLAGTASGLDDLGRLQVRHDQGVTAITVGEISVRAQA